MSELASKVRGMALHLDAGEYEEAREMFDEITDDMDRLELEMEDDA